MRARIRSWRGLAPHRSGSKIGAQGRKDREPERSAHREPAGAAPTAEQLRPAGRSAAAPSSERSPAALPVGRSAAALPAQRTAAAFATERCPAALPVRRTAALATEWAAAARAAVVSAGHPAVRAGSVERRVRSVGTATGSMDAATRTGLGTHTARPRRPSRARHPIPARTGVTRPAPSRPAGRRPTPTASRRGTATSSSPGATRRSPHRARTAVAVAPSARC